MQPRLIKNYGDRVVEEQICMMHIRPRGDQMHRHAFFELVYIVNGAAEHHLEQSRMTIKAGDYFIIDTGSTHCYQNPQDFEIINCLFLPEYIDRALADCPSLSALLSNQVRLFGVPVDLRTADRIFHDGDGSVGRLIRVMEQEHAQRRTGYKELLRCYLTQVLVHAARASEELDRVRPPHEATSAVVEYLQEHYAEPLSLNQLSELVGYTPQYLSNLFHRDTGMSIQNFLQRLRVEEACRRMGQNGGSLTEIAQAVGYTDAKHFARVFRRYKETSPKEYKQRYL